MFRVTGGAPLASVPVGAAGVRLTGSGIRSTAIASGRGVALSAGIEDSAEAIGATAAGEVTDSAGSAAAGAASTSAACSTPLSVGSGGSGNSGCGKSIASSGNSASAGGGASNIGVAN